MADLERHVARLHELVEEFESLEEGPLRDRIFELLEQIDHVHRSGVWRLFQLVTELGGKGLMDRVTLDPTVKLLFILYDLIPVDPLQPLQASVQAPAASADGFIPLSRIGGRTPAWQVAIARAELGAGSMHALQVNETPVLLCASGEAVTAFRNACGRSVLPLHLGRLQDGEIECPWHGCRYDAQTGQRSTGSGPSLEPFAVSVRDGVIYVATNTATAPRPVEGVQK